MSFLTKSIVYARFNLFSLMASFLALMIAYFLEPLSIEPVPLFYLTIILKLGLIFFSFLYYKLLFAKLDQKKKSSPKINFCFYVLEIIIDNLPLCEFLIEINLEMQLNRNNSSYMISLYFKPIYLGSKMLLNLFRKPSKALPMASLQMSFSTLAMGLNYGLMYPPSEKGFLSLLITEILLMILSFHTFLAMIGKLQDVKIKALKKYIDEMQEAGVLLMQKSGSYEVIFASEAVWKLFPLTRPLNFEALSNALPHFERLDTEAFGKADSRISSVMNSILPYESLMDILTFYSSLSSPDEILKFRTTPKPECLTDTEALGKDLEMLVKKMRIKKSTVFLLRFTPKETKKSKIRSKKEIELRLLHSISHELKTPLNSSLTLLELLRNQNSIYEETPNIYLDNSLASLKILESTLNNFIDYSLFLTDQFIICLGQVNLHTLMKEIFTITKSQIQLKNLDYSIELDGIFAKMTLYTDYTRLKQIILNLTLNSLQFTTTGSIKVEIHLTSRRNPLSVEFTIRDTGIGMSSSFLSHLESKLSGHEDSSDFEPNSTGSCLGLRMSHKLAHLLGVRGLQIESTLNQGTTVKFTVLDQSMDQDLAISRRDMDNIIIEEKGKNIDSFAAIIDETKKIEYIRRKNKTAKWKETSVNSSDDFNSEEIPSSIPKIGTDTFVLQHMKNHRFNKIMHETMWLESKEQMSISSKNKSPRSRHEKHEKGYFYSTVFQKNPKIPRKSEGNYNFNFNIPPQYKDKETLEIEEEPFSQPICIASKTIITSNMTNKNSTHTPKENIECACEEVLIVDDDAFNLLSLELILKTFSVPCVKAMNGKEAVDFVTNKSCSSMKCHGFKLILMDYQMPVMDGVESSKAILKLNNNEEGKHITIIGCTAFTTKSEVQNFLEAGLKDVIFKPLNKEIIGNILSEWLE